MSARRFILDVEINDDKLTVDTENGGSLGDPAEWLFHEIMDAYQDGIVIDVITVDNRDIT